MYNEKLAVAIKSAGKVLREFKDQVYLPFGSEYSLLIKNMNTVRALVTVTIDGTDVGDGTEFVINPNSSVDLERSITNGNMEQGNRFKFIERTASIEQHRGIGVEDGLIRVEFKYERQPGPLYRPLPFNGDPWVQLYNKTGSSPDPMWSYTSTTHTSNSSATPRNGGSPFRSMQAQAQAQRDGSVANEELTLSDAGITVPGSVSDQQFTSVASFPTEHKSHVIVLKLMGETEDSKPVKRPVNVKTKPKCTTCGRLGKATANFCTNCGTSLTIV